MKPLKDFTVAELVQRLASDFFQCLAKQDEAYVTVFGVGSGIGGKRDGERLAQQFFLSMGCLEKLDVSRQARRVGEHHAERDESPARVVAGEAGQEIYQWLLKIELATVVQDHAGSGGGNGFGDRSEIIHSDRAYAFGARCISEMPEPFMCDELAVMSYPHGCAGECALGDAGPQNVKGVLKLLVLVTGGVGQGLQVRVIGTLVQKFSSYCFCFRFITHSVH
jgi:hypothetical protein